MIFWNAGELFTAGRGNGLG